MLHIFALIGVILIYVKVGEKKKERQSMKRLQCLIYRDSDVIFAEKLQHFFRMRKSKYDFFSPKM